MSLHTPKPFAIILALTALAAAACGGGDRKPAGDETPPADTTMAAAPAGPTAQLIKAVDGFQAPEAVRWDPDQKVWFVANINGTPSAKDNNGFISRLKPDGSVETLKFIEGKKKGVTLNGPKGMAIVGDTLWVCDIDAVRGFNRKTGALVANIKVPGAMFINDITPGPDGLYATDTGVILGAGEPQAPRARRDLQDRWTEGDHRVQVRRAARPQRHHLGPERRAPRHRALRRQVDQQLGARRQRGAEDRRRGRACSTASNRSARTSSW